MGTFRDTIREKLTTYWNTPDRIYDSDNTAVEDAAEEISQAVSNSEHTALMDNMKAAMDSHKAMEAELSTLLQNLSTFMSAFSAWVPTGTLSDAVQLKAACSSSAAQVTAMCGTVEGMIIDLNTALDDLSSNIASYKG